MLTATLLALAAAGLHAGWNLAVKQAPVDRFMALWAQFVMAAVIATPIGFLAGGVPARAWVWIAISGAVHLPYCWFLARAYADGDFSLVYPIARGGGAMLAAIGGVALLGDDVSWLSGAAIVVVGVGLVTLAGHGRRADVLAALAVAATIGMYSTADARGIRSVDRWQYGLISASGTAIVLTMFTLATSRRRLMVPTIRGHWRRFAVLGAASAFTYFLVQLAFRFAPVGYVTALRESSVVLAAWIGWRHLGESAGRRRLAASLIVVAGLVLLVASRV